LKEKNEKLPENEEGKEQSGVSRRDFLVGAGTVVVGGAIGAGLLSSCGEGETVTTTVEKTKTVTTTLAGGTGATVTKTETVAGPGGATVTRTTTLEGPGGAVEPWQEPETSSIHMHCMAGFGSGGELGEMDIKNGKIVRIRPLHLDKSYSLSELAPSIWTFEARGKTYTPPLKGLLSYFACSYKKHVYGPNRIKYPLQRVDWEPGGDPAKINTQNRGKSKFKRISWDDAASIIASEIKRVQGTYGATSLMLQGDGHGEAKNVHAAHGCNFGLFDRIGVQYTTSVRNPDSWEGWYWGAEHVWGPGCMGLAAWNGAGGGANAGLTLLDVLQNGDYIVWMGDWETTPQGFNGQCATGQLFFMNEVGVKQIYVSPDLNYAAAVHAYKWIPILPGTDSALLLAILYVWLQEGTYDKDYLDTHTVGWDIFEKYVLGESDDMVAKTPEWASPRCGVPVYTIKALAREWAANRTSIGHYYGSAYTRGPYSHEVARIECALLAAQGMGRAGVHQIYNGCGIPRREVEPNPAWSGAGGGYALSAQNIPKTLHQDAILYHDMDNPIAFWGSSTQMAYPSDQYKKYVYPVPTEEGGAEVHMIWTDTTCHIACWPEGNVRIEAYRSPKIECIVAQHPTLENDGLYSDIVLPINTMLEEEDIVSTGFWIQLVNFLGMAHTGPGAQSVGESKSDYEAVVEVAKKLGDYGDGNAYDLYTQGMSVSERIKYGFDYSNISEHTTWENMTEKGYWIAPIASDWQDDPRGFINFYNNPKDNPLITPSGLLEIYSEKLAETFPDDNERGPYPKYVVGGPDGATDESLDVEYGAERCEKYPLLMQSQHPRWRTHVQCDDCTWLREIETCKVKGYDGYLYEPVWIHPKDAEARGIKNGDIVKVYNDRGIELGGARITERVHQGGVLMDHGARLDMITDGINRGGTVNGLIPSNRKHKYIPHLQIGTSYLVEVEKLSGEQMQEWRDKYPEAFARDYDPGSGLKFDAWIEGGND
jgi:trimethylamine-N-oxide reductase (cytochrome c)